MIKAATIDDANAIARVHVLTWQAAYAHALPTEVLDALSVEDRAERWREWLSTGRGATFVTESSGEVSGFVHVSASRDEPELGTLDAIYVLPEHWGSGAARDLIAAGEDALRERGVREATLIVLADNPRARRFYERHGWEVHGDPWREPIHGYEVDLVRYRKRL